MTENEWQGSAEEIAEKHLQTLTLWYPLADRGNKPQWKKLWMNTFSQLGQEGVDTILQKIQATRKYARKKMKNNTTGARMPPWLKELVACFNCKPALPVEAGLERPKLKMLRPKTSPDKTLTEVLATTGQTREDSPVEASGDFFKCRQCGCLPGFPGACSIHSELCGRTAVMSLASSGLERPPPMKKPPACKKPAACKKSLPGKKPASVKPTVVKKKKPEVISPSFGPLSVIKATEKSYTQYWVDGEKKLLVNVPGKRCDAPKVVDALVEHVLSTPGLEKGQMVAKKEELMVAFAIQAGL